MDTSAYRGYNGGTTQGRIDPPGAMSAPTSSVTIQQVLDEQEKELHQLFGTIQTFEERLSPVLTPVPGNQVAAAEKPSAPAQVLDRIAQHASGIRQASAWLQSLIGRLQL